MNAAMNEPMATSSGVKPDSLGRPPGPPAEARARTHRWRSAYRRRVLIVDALTLVAVIVVAQVAGRQLGQLHGADFTARTVFSVSVGIVWLIALGFADSRDLSLVSLQAEEYRRVAHATVW